MNDKKRSDGERSIPDVEMLSKAVAYDVSTSLTEVIQAERGFLLKLFGTAASIVALSFIIVAFLGFNELSAIKDVARQTAESEIQKFIADKADRQFLEQTKKLYVRSLVVTARLDQNVLPTRIDSAQISYIVQEAISSDAKDSFFSAAMGVLSQHEHVQGWSESVKSLVPYIEDIELRRASPHKAALILDMFASTRSQLPLRSALDLAASGEFDDDDSHLGFAAYRYLVNLVVAIPTADLDRILATKSLRRNAILIKSLPDDPRAKEIVSSISSNTDPVVAAELLGAALHSTDRKSTAAAEIITRLVQSDQFTTLWIARGRYDSDFSLRARIGVGSHRSYTEYFYNRISSSYIRALNEIVKTSIQTGDFQFLSNLFFRLRPEFDYEAMGSKVMLQGADVCGFLIRTVSWTEGIEDDCTTIRLADRRRGERLKLKIEAQDSSGNWSEIVGTSGRGRADAWVDINLHKQQVNVRSDQLL